VPQIMYVCVRERERERARMVGELRVQCPDYCVCVRKRETEREKERERPVGELRE